MADVTKDWELYENGKLYNNRLEPNYYETVNANIAFREGDQWRGLPDSEMPKPVINIIKPVIQFDVASLTTSKTKIRFEPMMHNKDNPDPNRIKEINGAELANKQVNSLFEKFKMDFRIKDALTDAATTGDACAHFYFDMEKKPYGTLFPNIKGEICMELVDGTNVMFGNANNPRTDGNIQPYIIVTGRDLVKNLREEQKRHREAKQQEAMQAESEQESNINSDHNYMQQSGDSGRIEVSGKESEKAEYIIVYRKVKKTRPVMMDGIPTLDEQGQQEMEEYTTITATKSVENAYIYQDIDTGLSVYPIAWMNWEKQKNQYHGRALCTGMLPNQIFINRMFAMAMYHLMQTAFPKAVYNADAIDIWNNAIGEAIPITGMGPDANIKNIAGYLEPGNMSAQIVQVIELVMKYSKEAMGINDTQLGHIDPTNTSAIIAVQKSSAIPLENPRANLYEWIEDIGHILPDMMGTYYGERPVMNDKGEMQIFDFSTLKDMWLNAAVDVGESSYWSEIAAGQTLDNLLAAGHMDIIQYLERLPDGMVKQKEELIDEIRGRMGDPFDAISGLTPEQQVNFLQQPPEIRQQILEELKNAQPMPIGA